MALGTVFIQERDIEVDFGVVVTVLNGLPGNLSGAPRDVPLSEGPELSGGIADPRLIRRKRLTPPEISGLISAASLAAAMTQLDALRSLLGEGEVRIRTAYAPDRWCHGFCETFEGVPFQTQVLNGQVMVKMLFTVAEGVAVRTVPDAYALSTGRAFCPIGSAYCLPIIILSNGGVTTPVVNPVITLRSANGEVAQTMSFTGSIGANDFWRVDCSRAIITQSLAGVTSDGLSLWTAGDFIVMRPADANFELGSWASLELSATSGVPVGQASYFRRFL